MTKWNAKKHLNSDDPQSLKISFIRNFNRWAIPAGIVTTFLGLVFMNQDVQSTLPKHTTTSENLAIPVLMLGMTLLSIRFFGLVTAWRLRRGKVKGGKSTIINLLATAFSVAIILGLVGVPAQALRLKLDPAAKGRYDASVAQANLDATNLAKAEQVKLDAAKAKKEQAAAAAQAAQQAKDKAAAQASLAAQAQSDAAASSAASSSLTLSKEDYQFLKLTREHLIKYLNTWANYNAGNVHYYQLDIDCGLLNVDNDIVKAMRTGEPSVQSKLDDVQFFLDDAAYNCSHSDSGYNNDRLRNAASSALAARNDIAYIHS